MFGALLLVSGRTIRRQSRLEDEGVQGGGRIVPGAEAVLPRLPLCAPVHAVQAVERCNR